MSHIPEYASGLSSDPDDEKRLEIGDLELAKLQTAINALGVFKLELLNPTPGSADTVRRTAEDSIAKIEAANNSIRRLQTGTTGDSDSQADRGV